MNRQFACGTLAALSIFAAAPGGAQAALSTGTLAGVIESQTFTVGDGSTTLFVAWSTYVADSSGWFYGGSAFGMDVYVASGLADPTTVANAASFAYAAGPLTAFEGDSVFVRSTSGHYAAVALTNFEAIDPPLVLEGVTRLSRLFGTWYFDPTMTGDFTSPIPEPSTFAFMIAGLGLLGLRLARTRTRNGSLPC